VPPQIGILEWYVAKARQVGEDKLNLPHGLASDMVYANAEMMALVKRYTSYALTIAFREEAARFLDLHAPRRPGSTKSPPSSSLASCC
jgi:hypothetical protein